MPNVLKDEMHNLMSAFKDLREVVSDDSKELKSDVEEKWEKVNEELTLVEVEANKIKAANEVFEQRMADIEKTIYAKDFQGMRSSSKEDQDHAEAFHLFLKTKGDNVSQSQYESMNKYFEAEMLKKEGRTDVDPLGGFLTPAEMETTIRAKQIEISPMLRNVSVGNTDRKEVEILVDNLTSEAFFIGEGATYPDTDTEFEKIVIPIRKIGVDYTTTDELLQDSIVNLMQTVTQNLTQKFGQRINRSILKGDTPLELEGLLPSPKITTVISSASGSYTADDVINVFGSLQNSYAGNAKWYLNRRQLIFIRKLKDLQGQYLWGGIGIEEGTPRQILGDPYEIADDMDGGLLPAADEIPILYGDLSICYQVYNRMGLAVIEDRLSKRKTGKTVFQFTQRIGGGIVIPEAAVKLQVAP